MSTSPANLAINEACMRLRRLRPAEAVRLGELARVCARSVGSGTEGAEILNEAMAGVLEGRRRWPADLPVDVFFSEVMRSIAPEWRQRAWREPLLDDQASPDIAVAPDQRAEIESVTALFRRCRTGPGRGH
jgi:DNA-directed RNA polymerase specialized sigma24 family protein